MKKDLKVEVVTLFGNPLPPQEEMAKFTEDFKKNNPDLHVIFQFIELDDDRIVEILSRK